MLAVLNTSGAYNPFKSETKSCIVYPEVRWQVPQSLSSEYPPGKWFLYTKTFLILPGSPYNSHYGFTPPHRNAWRSPINNVCLGSQEATRGVLNGNLGRGVPPRPSKPDSVWDKEWKIVHFTILVISWPWLMSFLQYRIRIFWQKNWWYYTR